MPKVIVPANQTIVLRGLKKYVGKHEIENFLQSIKCSALKFPPSPISDKTDKGDSKMVYINFGNSQDASESLTKIAAVQPPIIFYSEKFSAMFKSAPGASSKKEVSPSKSSSEGSDSESEADSCEETFAEFLVKHLKKKGGSMPAGPVGNLARKKIAWQTEISLAGGLKGYITEHNDQFEFVNDGKSQVIRSVKSVAVRFKIGDRLKIKSSIDYPSEGWGEIWGWSIGVLTKIERKRCTVDFPAQKGWKGSVDDLELAPAHDPTTVDCGAVDARFDSSAFVHFEGKRINFVGKKPSKDESRRDERGFVLSKNPLTSETPYFEVKIIGHSQYGIGIGLSVDSFSAGVMPGWFGGSIGFHSDDGCLFVNRNGVGSKFGPVSKVGDTIGCGLAFYGKTPVAVYFTRNGEIVGRVPILDEKMVYPVVCSVKPSIVEINFSQDGAKFQLADACSLRRRNGEIRTYPEVAHAVKEMSTGEVLTINACGMHVLTSPLVLKVDCQITGAPHGEEQGKAVLLNIVGQHVISCASENITLSNLKIISQGGKAKKPICNGAAGIAVHSGRLIVDNCSISSQTGTGLAVLVDETKRCVLLYLSVVNCIVGPCGRHGFVLHPFKESAEIQGTQITDCTITGLALNSGEQGVYKISQCSVTGCYRGIEILSSTSRFSEVTVEKCRDLSVYAQMTNSQQLDAFFSKCTFSKLTGMRAEGAKTRMLFDNLCSMPNLPPLLLEGAQITVVSESLNLNAAIDSVKTGIKLDLSSLQPPQPSGTDSVKSQMSKADDDCVPKNNFLQLCKLLLKVSPDVLLAVFKLYYHMAENVQFSETSKDCGGALLAKMDDHCQRKLGKTAVNKIKEAVCKEWDMTLLSSILMYSPGYLIKNVEAYSAVESLRNQRNSLVHGEGMKGLSISIAEFAEEWEKAIGSLEILLCLLPATESSILRADIQKIQSERLTDTEIDRFLQEVQAQIREIYEKAEDALMKAEYAATRSEVERKVIALEDMILKNGQIDGDRLPQIVELSNKSKYHLLRKVGSGGMGTVYAAISEDDTSVALKLCEVFGTDRGDREAAILQKLVTLKHRNIVRFLDSARLKSRLVIIMELVKGISLDIWLEKKAELMTAQDKEGWPVLWEDSKSIMQQVTDGMSAVHQMGIAHRDLKPANIMFDEVTEHIVIVDFGLSKEQNANQTVTNGTSVLGTAMYMSPEQLLGETRDIDIRTDVWSLGIICFELLQGHPPFAPLQKLPASSGSGSGSRSFCIRKQMLSKAEEAQMTTSILQSDVPETPAVPSVIRNVIVRALIKQKMDRFANAQEMHEALQDAWTSLAQSPCATSPAVSNGDVKSWTVEQVVNLLRTCKFDSAIPVVVENSIDGKTLLSLTDEELTMPIEEQGLGLKKLQVKRLRQELKTADGL